MRNPLEMFKTMWSVLWTAMMAAVMTGNMKPLMNGIQTIKSDCKGIADLVLGGIMIVIIGFAMIIIGIYIYFTIQTSLPVMASTSYNTTVTSINSYATTVFPLMGLVLMILGFAIIFIALRMGLGGAAPGGKR